MNQDKTISREEAGFHIYNAFINLIYAKFSKDKDEAVCNELKSQIPSLLYLFYKEEIFTEKFIEGKMIKKDMIFNSFLYNQDQQEVEKKFLVEANPFLHWYQNSPFEDEEGNYKGLNYIEPTKVTKEPETNEIDDL